jgi:hypothetical protein
MLRGQMAEFGIVVATGAWHVKELVSRLRIPGEVARDSGMISRTIPI